MTVVVDKVRRRPCLAANTAVSCSSESKGQRAARRRRNQTARKAQRARAAAHGRSGVGKSGQVSEAKGISSPAEKAKAQRRGRRTACVQVMPTASLEDVADELDDVNPRYPRPAGTISPLKRSARRIPRYGTVRTVSPGSR